MIFFFADTYFIVSFLISPLIISHNVFGFASFLIIALLFIFSLISVDIQYLV